jgi:plastocyanin
MNSHTDHQANLSPTALAGSTDASPESAGSVASAPVVLEGSGAAPVAASNPNPAASSKGTITLQVTSTPANAAKNAVAYLENAPKDREVNGTLDNRQMAFVPYVVVATAGSKITFTNSDPYPHNVFSPDNEKWDMGVIPSKGARIRKFENSGVYTALCNMHPNMKAYIVVTPSSYFGKASKTGEIALKDVPSGSYQMVIWAPGVKTAKQHVTVSGDAALSIELHR